MEGSITNKGPCFDFGKKMNCTKAQGKKAILTKTKYS